MNQELDNYGENATAQTLEELLTLEGTRYTTSSTNDYEEAINNIYKIDGYKESIKKNGGIFTPIIVNHKTSDDRYIVIEGNTRLKFYQEFYEKEKDEIFDSN